MDEDFLGHVPHFLTALAIIISLASCSDMTAQQQRMLSGTAIGAGVGAAGAGVTGGCVSCGAAIGAGAGAAGGYLYDRSQR